MKNKLITLLATLLLTFSITITCSASEEKIHLPELQQKNLTLNSELYYYIINLKNYSLVNSSFTEPEVDIMITKEFPTLFEKPLKHTIIYFYKHKLTKIEFSFKNVEDKNEILEKAKTLYTSNYYKYKAFPNTNGKEEAYAWQSNTDLAILAYTAKEPVKPHLTFTLYSDYIIDDPIFKLKQAAK